MQSFEDLKFPSGWKIYVMALPLLHAVPQIPLCQLSQAGRQLCSTKSPL